MFGRQMQRKQQPGIAGLQSQPLDPQQQIQQLQQQRQQQMMQQQLQQPTQQMMQQERMQMPQQQVGGLGGSFGNREGQQPMVTPSIGGQSVGRAPSYMTTSNENMMGNKGGQPNPQQQQQQQQAFLQQMQQQLQQNPQQQQQMQGNANVATVQSPMTAEGQQGTLATARGAAVFPRPS